MLCSLHIENLAVIKTLDIDFAQGFTAFTGQTGAGKSIIIDGINLLLGKKADKELIRAGESSAMVSGLFSGVGEKNLCALAEIGIAPDDEGSFFVQRTLFSDGRSQLKLNGRSISLSLLRSAASFLVDIHGQNDTHSLTDPKTHIDILDGFADNKELLSKYAVAFSEYDNIRKEIRSLNERERERERLSEILEYQINDIDSLKLTPGEEDALIDKKLKMKNSERITKQAGFVFKALKGSEKGSVSFLLDRSISSLTAISDVLPAFAEYSDRLREFLYQIDDIAEEVYAAIEDIDTDPTEKLNAIESRLDKISKIKRKYGYSVEEVLAFRDRAERELSELKNSDEVLRELTVRLEKARSEALDIAEKLHERRESAAREIEAAVKETLEFLDMPKVVFFASLKKNVSSGETVLSSLGFDNVEFFISANKGMDAQPLAKIASGGELARIMLAIKSVIADKEGVGTLIFDEIDAGVSGKTARKIGLKMSELSAVCQIISVTHSAQIASLADWHLLITKSEIENGVSTGVCSLDYDGRVAELSRILGGIDVTDAQRAAAVDMLAKK